MQFGSPNRATAYARTYAARKIQRMVRRSRRVPRRIGSTQLIRSAIASRVNTFKRTTEAFGYKAGITGTSTERLINAGSAPDQLLTIANQSASQFVQGCYQHGGSFQFMLAHVTNVGEITQLYDNYRIKMVYVNVIPSFNQSDVGAGTASNSVSAIPTMHYTLDNDDAVAPTSRNSVLQNSYCKSVRLEKPFTIAVKPRAQNVIAATTSTPGGAQYVAGGMLPANQWLDCSSTNVPHYGLKFWMDEWPTITADVTGSPFLKFTVTYILEAKNVV